MKIHAIKITSEVFKAIFLKDREINYRVVKNGLSDDAILIGMGRISGTNNYELLFEAESGVKVTDGDAIHYNNPEFETIER